MLVRVPVNRRGHAVGEGHAKARLTWDDVALMRELYERHRLPMSEVARKFDVPWSTTRDVLRYLTWVERPARYLHIRRTVRVRVS